MSRTGYPALDPAWTSLFKINLPSLACLIAETDGKVELDGLGGKLTSRQGMKLSISPDDEGINRPLIPSEKIISLGFHGFSLYS